MIQNWKKLGRIYNPLLDNPTGYTYAAVPIIREINTDSIIILFTTRNKKGKSVLSQVTICKKTFKHLTSTEVNLLIPGEIGNFDEDGVMACDLFKKNGINYLTYIGWNKAITVPFRNAIGLATCKNGSFVKNFDGPILDRSMYDPCFVASNCVIQINQIMYMYYLSCFKWSENEGMLTHFYDIKIAISEDGIHWQPTGKTAISFKNNVEYAISVPRVKEEDGIFKMWYSYRGSVESKFYRIGYAESVDGIDWIRKDDKINFENDSSEWDSNMMCYPYIFELEDTKYMLYNGNDYGKTGIGLAKLVK